MSYLDSVKIGVECLAYKWQLFQVESYHQPNDIPCAVFFHDEEARVAFDYLSSQYKTIRFVLTNIRTGASYVG